MFIVIKNTPRTYAWGSTDALPAVLSQEPTGEPQAELWLGDHAGDPAEVSGDLSEPITLIDLIAQNPSLYGVDGGHLPFLLKLLGIGAPLSLQVHPRIDQAQEGFARETAAGIAVDAPTRSYKDANHKPELLVALSQVRALGGFRLLTEVAEDVEALAAAVSSKNGGRSGDLNEFSREVSNALRGEAEAGRAALLDWIFSDDEQVGLTIRLISDLVKHGECERLSATRLTVLRELSDTYPGDPGILLSLLMRVVVLQPGQAMFLDAGQLHAYLSGVAVEVMASSDNVLRAGLTEKYVDVEEFRMVLDLGDSESPLFPGVSTRRGLTTWQPPITDFVLHRVCVEAESDPTELPSLTASRTVTLEAQYPLVLIVTRGVMRIERTGSEPFEVASVRKGHSLYVSAGGVIEFSGSGEAFVATVGDGWLSDVSGTVGVS